jgi:uncharacterized protein (TIGR02118 family)
MFKLMVFVAKRDGMTMEAFVDHYETRHVPLIARVAPAPAAYRRIYLTRDAPLGRGVAGVDFDAMTELWFADKAAYRDWMAAISVDEVAQDEARFMDRARTRAFVVETHGDAL